LGTALTDEGQPAVVCVEKPYLDGFIEGVAQTIGVPFVLLALNGGDEPLTCDMQARLAQLPCLKACFGNNLHQPQVGTVPLVVNEETWFLLIVLFFLFKFVICCCLFVFIFHLHPKQLEGKL
ncbi:unnamed protein product, partial [Polarella glacialis]